MTAQARFKQIDIARAMKAAKAAGYSAVHVRIDRNGNIDIMADDKGEAVSTGNPWDDVLQ